MKIKPFTPPKLPLKKLNWEKILPYLGKAHEVMGELNEILKSSKDPLSTLAFLKTQEAVDSVHAKKSQAAQSLPAAARNDQKALEFAIKSRQPFTDQFFFGDSSTAKCGKKKR